MSFQDTGTIRETLEKAKKLEEAVKNDPEVDIYALGPFSASVCSSLDVEATVERVNEMMQGLTRWNLSEDDHFANGQPMPCPCENNPERQHFLLE